MRGRDFSVSGEVRIASNGLKLMKEKFKEGTREQLRTPKAIRKTDTGGGKYQCRQSHEWAVQTVMAKRSMT